MVCLSVARSSFRQTELYLNVWYGQRRVELERCFWVQIFLGEGVSPRRIHPIFRRLYVN